MKTTDDRKLFDTLIGASAASGNIATIPQTQATAGDGTASLALGFPPETFIARAAGGEPPRGQDMNGFLNRLSAAVQILQAGYLGPFDETFAQGIGGYPAGAIVSGATAGTFWVSTADANVSVPGATGATWQSLFNGYATQAWANGQFLQLALATLQSVAGPVAFESAPTVPDASSSKNPVALGQLPGLTTGRLIGIQTFTASGTYTKTPGATFAIGDVQGGGGAGGGVLAQSANTIGVSGPGAGGAFVRIKFSLDGIATLAITVGKGGVNVPSSAGLSGAASSIGSLATAPGGYGGHSGPPGTSYWIDDGSKTGAAPSTDTSVIALLALPVQAPTGGFTLSATSLTGGKCGRGGSSFYGLGAPEVRAQEAVPSNGPVPGSGGSGNCVSQYGSAQPGGNGADGLVTIWEFA